MNAIKLTLFLMLLGCTSAAFAQTWEENLEKGAAATDLSAREPLILEELIAARDQYAIDVGVVLSP